MRSAGVIVAGLLLAATGNGLRDTNVALAIGKLVAACAIILGRQDRRHLLALPPHPVHALVVVADDHGPSPILGE